MTLIRLEDTSIHKQHGQTKLDRYKWPRDNDKPRLGWINKSLLLIDTDYQRGESAARIAAISSAWSWIACGALVVSQRPDGQYAVIDGQHRLAAAMRRADIDELPCVVFGLRQVAEEASGFVTSNCSRKIVSPIDKHRAAVVALDEVALQLDRVISEAGLLIQTTGKPSVTHKALRCVATCRRLLVSPNGHRLPIVLSVCVASMSGPGLINDRVLVALDYIDRNVRDGNALDNAMLVSRIIAVGMDQLQLAANKAVAIHGSGGEKIYAVGVLDAVNKTLRRRFTLSV